MRDGSRDRLGYVCLAPRVCGDTSVIAGEFGCAEWFPVSDFLGTVEVEELMLNPVCVATHPDNYSLAARF